MGGEAGTGASSVPLLRREPGVTAPLPVRQAAARVVRTGPVVDPVLLGRVRDALLRLSSGDPLEACCPAAPGCVTFTRWQMAAR
jgi:hypothetical protein